MSSTPQFSPRPPVLTFEMALAIIRNRYGIADIERSSFKELPSYDDRHYYFLGSLDGGLMEELVLRVTNLMFSPDLVQGLNSLMLHLSSQGINCSVPISSSSGRYMEMVPGNEISLTEIHPQQYPVRVLKFIPGTLLDDLRPELLTPNFLYSLGQFAGNVDTALQDFSNLAVESFVKECWDLQHFSCLKKYIPSLSDQKKVDMANTVMKLYEENLQPKMGSLRKGIIHGDLNGQNIIVKELEGDVEIVGLIDFGDCVHTCYLFELAAIVAFTLMRRNKPLDFVAPIIKGYLNSFPLGHEEVQYLYYAVLTMVCTNGVRVEYVATSEPDNAHLQYYIHRAWRLLSTLLPLSKKEIDILWNITSD